MRQKSRDRSGVSTYAVRSNLCGSCRPAELVAVWRGPALEVGVAQVQQCRGFRLRLWQGLEKRKVLGFPKVGKASRGAEGGDMSAGKSAGEGGRSPASGLACRRDPSLSPLAICQRLLVVLTKRECCLTWVLAKKWVKFASIWLGFVVSWACLAAQ